MIEVEAVTKIYRLGDTEVRALDGVDLRIGKGEMTAIMGPSGSGKSTLMAILGCLDVPTSGAYRLDGENVENLSDNQLADIRSRKIGFVFQQFNLLARTTALDNVMLPLTYSGVHGRARRERAQDALQKVGLGDRMHHRPNELSGGQQQRVAIARALVNDPAILLADEPTGNLDSKTGTEIIRLFQRLHRELGLTVLYVTHDPFIARHTERVIRLADGQVVGDEKIDHPIEAGTPRPSELALAPGGRSASLMRDPPPSLLPKPSALDAAI
ncbi:MAG: ABC transporter ATP-binding protein [Chloroflexi bacterium]|nr:ABC transporter ATP-binding protein [Chloroflexota bacterium]